MRLDLEFDYSRIMGHCNILYDDNLQDIVDIIIDRRDHDSIDIDVLRWNRDMAMNEMRNEMNLRYE